MRVAAIYDIHGNLPALEAVLQEIRQAQVDQIVVGGTEIFTRLTPEERLLPIFEGLNVAVVICGHTHMQFDRTIRGVRVVNAGSVGMPYGQPGAYWLLMGPHVEHRHTLYDLSLAAERIRDTDYPHAQDFAAHNVLQPPSEGETLEVFAKVELR